MPRLRKHWAEKSSSNDWPSNPNTNCPIPKDCQQVGPDRSTPGCDAQIQGLPKVDTESGTNPAVDILAGTQQRKSFSGDRLTETLPMTWVIWETAVAN